MERVAIVGTGQTRHAACREELNYPELVYEAVSLALEDAAIGIEGIDNVVTTSNDFWDGRTISSMATGDVSGGHGKNISCVEGDGTFGAFYGLTRILSGAYGTTLVTAYSKGSESVSPLVTNAVFDPIYTRCIGLDMVTACALQARCYMKRYGISEEQCALVSVKNHGNAMHNPNAHLAMKLGVEEVMKSRTIATPLKLYDISPVSDGACAVVLASEERAGKIDLGGYDNISPGSGDPGSQSMTSATVERVSEQTNIRILFGNFLNDFIRPVGRAIVNHN